MPVARWDAASLAYYARSGRQEQWRFCPKRPQMLKLNEWTGELSPNLCNRYNCPVCVRAEAFRYGRAIGVSRPQQHVLLTLGGHDWQEIHAKLKHLRRLLRARLRSHEHVAHVEANPRGTGTHLHLFCWGCHLTVWLLRECAARAGFGYSDIELRRLPEGHPITYGVKVVIDGSPDGPGLPDKTDEFLALNDGQLGHATQGFWRDPSGKPVKGWRKAALCAPRTW